MSSTNFVRISLKNTIGCVNRIDIYFPFDIYRKNPRKLNAIGKPMSARESLWEWWKCERERLPAPQLLSSPLSAPILRYRSVSSDPYGIPILLLYNKFHTSKILYFQKNRPLFLYFRKTIMNEF